MKIKNFEIGLLDLQNDKIFIKIKEPFRSTFFNYMVGFAGSITKLAQLVNGDIRKFRMNFWNYRKGIHSTPLRFIKSLLSALPQTKQKEFGDMIQFNIEEIKSGDSGKPIKNPKFLIKFSPALARIIGHVIGDGFIEEDHHIVWYVNKSHTLIDQLKEDVRYVFGEINVYQTELKQKNAQIVLLPSIVGKILAKFCGSQVGDLKHIPKVILKVNKNSKSLFLRALFDDEGSIHKTIQEITFQMASKDIVEKVKMMLKEFGIKAGKICERKGQRNVKIQYRFNITGRANLEHFFKKISFDHPKKRGRLKIMIKSYKMFRRKKGEDEKLIIEMLKGGSKMNKYEVARKLKGKPDSVRKKLCKLEREGIINSIRDGKFKVYYL